MARTKQQASQRTAAQVQGAPEDEPQEAAPEAAEAAAAESKGPAEKEEVTEAADKKEEEADDTDEEDMYHVEKIIKSRIVSSQRPSRRVALSQPLFLANRATQARPAPF